MLVGNCVDMNYENIKQDVDTIIHELFDCSNQHDLIDRLINFGDSNIVWTRNMKMGGILSYSLSTNNIKINSTSFPTKRCRKNVFVAYYMHELGHYYFMNFLSYLSFTKCKKVCDPIEETVSILFELLSSLILRDKESFYYILQEKYFISRQDKTSIEEYIASRATNVEYHYLFGFMFALNMLHKHGVFEGGNFKFSLQGVEDEIRTIEKTFEKGENLITYFQEKFFNADAIKEVLESIDSYFNSNPTKPDRKQKEQSKKEQKQTSQICSK